MSRLSRRYSADELKLKGYADDFIDHRTEYHDALIFKSGLEGKVNVKRAIVDENGKPLSLYKTITRLAGIHPYVGVLFGNIISFLTIVSTVIYGLGLTEMLSIPYLPVVGTISGFGFILLGGFSAFAFLQAVKYLPLKPQNKYLTAEYSEELISAQQKVKEMLRKYANLAALKENDAQRNKELVQAIDQCKHAFSFISKNDFEAALAECLSGNKKNLLDSPDQTYKQLEYLKIIDQYFKEATPSLLYRVYNNFNTRHIITLAFGVVMMMNLFADPTSFLLAGTIVASSLTKLLVSYSHYARHSYFEKKQGFLRSFLGGVVFFLPAGRYVKKRISSGRPEDYHFNPMLSLSARNNIVIIFCCAISFLLPAIIMQYTTIPVATIFPWVWGLQVLAIIEFDTNVIGNTMNMIFSPIKQFIWKNNKQDIPKTALGSMASFELNHLAPEHRNCQLATDSVVNLEANPSLYKA